MAGLASKRGEREDGMQKRESKQQNPFSGETGDERRAGNRWRGDHFPNQMKKRGVMEKERQQTLEERKNEGMRLEDKQR